jgi:small subunit ribosomal protein S2
MKQKNIKLSAASENILMLTEDSEAVTNNIILLETDKPLDTPNSNKKIIPEKLIKLLEANLHIGHNANQFNPKMFPYLYTQKNDLDIIDLVQTARSLERAYEFIYNASFNKQTILFVGTKLEAREIIAFEAIRSNSPYINYQWLGGLLTNWQTIQPRIKRLKNLEQKETTNVSNKISKKDAMILKRELKKLNIMFKGIKNMKEIPDIIVVIDQHIEKRTIQEAKILNIPIISIIDTDCNPDLIDIPIPGNDDSCPAIKLVLSRLADAIITGNSSSI